MATFEKKNIADEKKEMIEMPRHSFIQMTKLHNVMGRIDYITSIVKQENLYAIYATQPLRSFWKDLAKCNREEFAKSGTIGKCIEARELIIALPEGLYHYEHDYLIKHFATDFKKKYGVDCFAALHHNKRKTNFHIHLIFAERTKLEKPVVKVASRNMFYDENGKHVRTKKEILDESGNIRNGCKIIRKGEVYEKKEFSVKDDRFKRDSFLDEAKVFFTNEINQLVLHEEDKLKVFDKNSPYLATKKIGKNNPMEEQIKADNEVRQEWNRTVDRAIVSGMSEEDISSIKKKEITEKVRDSIDLYGDRPDILASIIKLAIAVLELLINRIMLATVGVAEKVLDVMPGAGTGEATKTKVQETAVAVPHPEMSPLASKYVQLKNVHKELQRQNEAIFGLERNRSNLEIELSDCNGVFKSGKRTELQKQIDELDCMINNMKRQLSSIVQEYGYDNVREFYSDYYASKGEYEKYNIREVEKWKKKNEKSEDRSSIDKKVYYNQSIRGKKR